MSATQRRRLERLVAAAPCRDPRHPWRWIVLENDEPPPPPCPTCGTSPRVHRLYLRGVSLEDL